MFGIKWFHPERLNPLDQLWLKEGIRDLGCSSQPLYPPAPRMLRPEQRQEGEGWPLFVLLVLIVAEAPCACLFFVFLLSHWPTADCRGRNEPDLASSSCFLPGLGTLLFPAEIGLNTTHQACGERPFTAWDPLPSSKNSFL